MINTGFKIRIAADGTVIVPRPEYQMPEWKKDSNGRNMPWDFKRHIEPDGPVKEVKGSREHKQKKTEEENKNA